MPAETHQTTLTDALAVAQAEGLEPNARRFLSFLGHTPEVQALGVPIRFSENMFAFPTTVDNAVRLIEESERQKPTGVYVIANEIDPAIRARAVVDRWHPQKGKGTGTKDSDILRRAVLFVDVDWARPTGISTTDEECAVALAAGVAIYERLSRAVPQSSLGIGHSGNCSSVFAALDHLPESGELYALCREIVLTLDAIYTEPRIRASRATERNGIDIDTSVVDAKRLVPAFGTVKRKGVDGSPERPHRRTAFVCSPELTRLSLGDLTDLLADLRSDLSAGLAAEVDKMMGRRTTPTVTMPAARGPASAPAQGDPFRAAKECPISDVLQWLGLGDAEQPCCPGCGEEDGSSVAIVGNGLKCSHNRCASKGFAKGFRTTIDLVCEVRNCTPIEAVRALSERFGFVVPPAGPVAQAGRPPPLPAPLAPTRFRRCTDLGNAERLADLYGPSLRFCADVGRFTWDGSRWELDRMRVWQRCASATVRNIGAEAAACDDPAMRKSLLDHARKSESASALSAMAKLAENFEGVVCTIDQLDADPFLFNAANGTVDLRTGALRAHDPLDLITKVSGATYEADAVCPAFDAFMSKVFAGDAELIAFLQRFVGYCLTGDVREQVLLFCHGGGANGKSTFIDLLVDLMGGFGGYAAPGAPDLLIARKNENHPTELADLRGARVVTCVEIGDGKRFDEERVKALTGGDRVKARFMRENFFSFAPTHKLILAANHKPVVRGTDLAIWRRILLVPFLVTFTEADKDRDMPARLRAELPGILAWAVRGALEWQRAGLRPPAVVTAATDAYRAEQDAVGRFISDCCTSIGELKTGATALYNAYKDWANEQGEFVITQRKFGEALAERGFVPGRLSGGRGASWGGIGLLQKDNDNNDGRYCGSERWGSS